MKMKRNYFLLIIVFIVLCGISMVGSTQSNKYKKKNIVQNQTSKIINIMPLGNSLKQASEPGYRGFLYKVLDSMSILEKGKNSLDINQDSNH